MLLSRSPAHNRVRRQAAPVNASIHWKPLRDPHYVVASLQPDNGRRRQIFVKQAVLARLHALARNAAANYSDSCSADSSTARRPARSTS